MKLIQLVLYNDRLTFVDAEKIVYATSVSEEDTGQELTRIVFDNGVELDVQDKTTEMFDEINLLN